MIYCYDKRIAKNEDIIREINVARKNHVVIVYDEITKKFYDLNGNVYSIKGQKSFS